MLDNYVLTSLEFRMFKGDIVADCIEVVFFTFGFFSFPFENKLC